MSVHSKNVQDPLYIYSGYKKYLRIIVFIIALTQCLIKCECNSILYHLARITCRLQIFDSMKTKSTRIEKRF